MIVKFYTIVFSLSNILFSTMYIDFSTFVFVYCFFETFSNTSGFSKLDLSLVISPCERNNSMCDMMLCSVNNSKICAYCYT